jgi:SAM-dependent methyltransferase
LGRNIILSAQIESLSRQSSGGYEDETGQDHDGLAFGSHPRRDAVTDYYLDPRVAEAYDADMGRDADTMDDVPFYLELANEARNAGAAVLELGCGTGRVTIPVARDGIDVVGLDSSPAMLDIARRKAAAAAVDVAWVEADMRDLDLRREFGLVIVPFRSFLHLLTDADQQACLACIRRHLLPDGRLALNFFVPRFPGGPGSGPNNGRRPAPLISRIYDSMKLRYVLREEMESALDEAGFEVEALYGWFDRRPFTSESDEMVWVARLSQIG